MLLAAGERLVHVPGLAVNRARQGSVGGQAKSDPKDARVIADQLRLRAGDFRPVALEDDTIAELRLLVGRRDDLVTDQTRRISRMRYLLNTIHPDLERALDLTNAGPLSLLARYVTAAEIRAPSRRPSPGICAPRPCATQRRSPRPPSRPRLPTPICSCRPRLSPPSSSARWLKRRSPPAPASAAIDRRLAELVAAHPDGALIRSLPGMGAVLAAEFLAEAGEHLPLPLRRRPGQRRRPRAGAAPVRQERAV